MKGYISFIIVFFAILLAFSAVFLSSIKQDDSNTLAIQKIRNEEIDLSISIEESAKVGAAAGIVFYLALIALEPMPLEEIYSRIDTREMEYFARNFAILSVEQIETEKHSKYAIFCTTEKFNELSLENNMLEERTLVIPKEAKHFSLQNCIDSIDVHISLPSINENKIVQNNYNDIIDAFSTADINVYLTNPSKENGIIGISIIDTENNIAVSHIMERRVMQFKLGDMSKNNIIQMLEIGHLLEPVS